MKAGRIQLNAVIRILFLTLIFCLCAGCPVTDGDTELPWTYPPGVTDKSDFSNGQVKAALSVSGGEDPLIALRYRMDNANGPYYFDYVVLSSAKMRKVVSGGAFTFDLDLGDIQDILNNRVTKLAPLQSKGFKILLEVSNGGDGYSFANLPYTLRQPFAKTIKDTLDRYGLDGIEFNDINGGAGAYPVIGQAFYDPDSDEEVNPNQLGDTVTVSNNYEADDYWHTGGNNYGAFLSYFRYQQQSPSTPATAVIGKQFDKPILVRENGFAGGDFGSPHENKFYMDHWISDAKRPEMTFTSVMEQINYILYPGAAPFSDTASRPFGWEGSGQSIMPHAVHSLYAPGVLDLRTASNEEIAYFSERFANGNLDKSDEDMSWGESYGLLYYAGLGGNDAGKLSITSRWVYGTREEGRQHELIAVQEDGPEVLYVAGN